MMRMSAGLHQACLTCSSAAQDLLSLVKMWVLLQYYYIWVGPCQLTIQNFFFPVNVEDSLLFEVWPSEINFIILCDF